MSSYGQTVAIPIPHGKQVWGVFMCDNCHALSIAIARRLDSSGPSRLLPDDVWLDQQQSAQWLPTHASGKEFPDVPEHIAEAASEAYMCADISAFRSAVQMARSVVEATAKDKGITTGRLVEKIDRLFDQRYIREHIKDGAHEVRHLGNEMAHGDFINPVSDDEAELVLTLMSEILEEVYQSPARVQRAKEARAAKEGRRNSP